MDPATRRTGIEGVTKLALIAALGQVISYVLAVYLARNMSVDGFRAQAVASSVFLLMVTPIGIDKYALR